MIDDQVHEIVTRKIERFADLICQNVDGLRVHTRTITPTQVVDIGLTPKDLKRVVKEAANQLYQEG